MTGHQSCVGLCRKAAHPGLHSGKTDLGSHALMVVRQVDMENSGTQRDGVLACTEDRPETDDSSRSRMAP